VTAGRITLAVWLTRWLAMVKPTVEPNTYPGYFIGGVPVDLARRPNSW
jgi:hypothetical protein